MALSHTLSSPLALFLTPSSPSLSVKLSLSLALALSLAFSRSLFRSLSCPLSLSLALFLSLSLSLCPSLALYYPLSPFLSLSHALSFGLSLSGEGDAALVDGAPRESQQERVWGGTVFSPLSLPPSLSLALPPFFFSLSLSLTRSLSRSQAKGMRLSWTARRERGLLMTHTIPVDVQHLRSAISGSKGTDSTMNGSKGTDSAMNGSKGTELLQGSPVGGGGGGDAVRIVDQG